MINKSAIFTLAFLGLLQTLCIAQQPLNLDFEQKSIEGINRPWGWSSYYFGNNASAKLDSQEVHSGAFALKVTNQGIDPYRISYWIAPRMLRGQRLMLTAWAKTSSDSAKASLTFSTIGEPGVLALQTTEETKSPAWTKLETDIKIDSAAYSLVIELFTRGKGKVWFDDISLSVDGNKLDNIPVAPPFSKKQIDLLSQHAHPFKNINPIVNPDSLQFDELEHFGKMVEGAKIIGLGESTHGTSEFFSMKHRLLQYAVEKLNCRIFALEDNQLQVELINDYVLYGKGSVENLICKLFGVWNTEEVLNLIEWVRNYNLQHPHDKVEFVGFDFQNPTLPIETISKTLAELDPDLKLLVDSLYADFYAAWQKSHYPRSDLETMKSWYDKASKALELIEANVKKRTDLSKNPDKEINWLLQNARSVKYAASAYTGDVILRDQYMAENLKWIIKQKRPKGPVVVWAHDVHINFGHGPDATYNYFEGSSMGTFLRKEYGEGYKAFGLFTYAGTYATYLHGKAIEAPAFPAPKGSIDEALHQIAKANLQKNYILDLTWARKNPYDHFWLIEPRPVRFATYFPADYGYETMVSLPFQFDGIIFIDKTSTARKLR